MINEISYSEDGPPIMQVPVDGKMQCRECHIEKDPFCMGQTNLSALVPHTKDNEKLVISLDGTMQIFTI